MKRGYCLWCHHPKSDHDGSRREQQALLYGAKDQAFSGTRLVTIRWTVTACSELIDMTGEPCKCRRYEVGG